MTALELVSAEACCRRDVVRQRVAFAEIVVINNSPPLGVDNQA